MFVVSVTFEAEPGRAAEFLARVLRQARDSLTRETGCLRFDVCSDRERPGRVFLYEVYTGRAAFEAHLASAHFRDFERETGPMLAHRVVETWVLAG